MLKRVILAKKRGSLFWILEHIPPVVVKREKKRKIPEHIPPVSVFK
jgi:hypothetical protein